MPHSPEMESYHTGRVHTTLTWVALSVQHVQSAVHYAFQSAREKRRLNPVDAEMFEKEAERLETAAAQLREIVAMSKPVLLVAAE